MAEHGWQWQKKVVVAGSGATNVALPGGRPLLERFTIWVSSGARVLTNMSCQPRINEKSFGAAVAFVGAVAADPIFDSTATGRVLPVGRSTLTGAETPVDPFDFDVRLTNAGLVDEECTVYFAAVGRD